MTPLVPLPAKGRRFTTTRQVRLGDATLNGRLRLDAVVRYLQDVAADDSADSGLPDAGAWVVRKTTLEVATAPRYGERLELTTFCSGVGSRWAERRTSVTGDRGGAVEAASIWVYVDLATGRPRRLPEAFEDLYGEACGGRQVKARLVHGDPPAEGGSAHPWPLRASDFDVLGHVNNAAYWEPVEDLVAGRGLFRAPVRAELEHRLAVEPDASVAVVTEEDPLRLWWVVGGAVAASALVGPG